MGEENLRLRAKKKLLRVIGIMLHLKLEVNVI